jgi:hypothetical protein
LVNGGTGSGKTVFLMALIGQWYYHGAARIDIIDPKDISLNAFKGIPGITINRLGRDEDTGVSRWVARLNEFYEEMGRRYEILNEDEDTEFDPWFFVIEEINSFRKHLDTWWARSKEKGQPRRCPALDTFETLLFKARQCGIHVVVASQQANADAIGGSAGRDQFAVKALARFSPNLWKMLIGFGRPPKLARIRGRWLLVIGDVQSQVQTVYGTPREWREFALSRPTPVTQGEHVADVTGAPELEDSRDDVTDMVTDGGEPSGSGPARVTLPQAVDMGILPWTKDNARQYRSRDAEFPAGIGTGKNQTHDVDELRAYVANLAVRQKVS